MKRFKWMTTVALTLSASAFAPALTLADRRDDGRGQVREQRDDHARQVRDVREVRDARPAPVVVERGRDERDHAAPIRREQDDRFRDERGRDEERGRDDRFRDERVVTRFVEVDADTAIHLADVPRCVLDTVTAQCNGRAIETTEYLRRDGIVSYRFRLGGSRQEPVLVTVAIDGHLLGVDRC